MLRSFSRNLMDYCFSPCIKMAPIPHYLYDILNENPFKVLNIIKYEFRFGLFVSALIFLIFWGLLFGNIMLYFDCNFLICSWIILISLINQLIFVPRFLILKQIMRACQYVEDFQMIEGVEIHDALRNLLWNKIFQTKIYFFTQTMMKNLSFSYFSGIMLLIIDSGEHGFLKACHNDGGLKKLCLLIICLSLAKFLFITRIISEQFNFQSHIQTKKMDKEESVRLKSEDKVCSICLLDFEENQKINYMRCKHFFHKLCIENWLRIKRKCPLCNHF